MLEILKVTQNTDQHIKNMCDPWCRPDESCRPEGDCSPMERINLEARSLCNPECSPDTTCSPDRICGPADCRPASG